MNGIITSFRRGRHCLTENQVIVKVDGISNKEDATKLVGKEVKFICSGKDKKSIAGKVSAVHGNSGAVRALFETGLPGQAIGTKVTLA
jgi:large subunit ribosomal protein L35Ae